MKLRLTVITYRNQPTSMPMGTIFGMEGGTIGRAADNDWVLPDPERFISSKHASIQVENGQFYLTDTSTNGVYFNTQPQPIGKGNSTPLSDGDRIVVGDYEIEVALDNQLPENELSSEIAEDFFSPSPTSEVDYELPGLDDTATGENTGPSTDSFFNSSDTPPSSPPIEQIPADQEFFQAPHSIPEDWDIMEEQPVESAAFSPSKPTPSIPEPKPSPVNTPPTQAATHSTGSDLESLNKLLDGAGIKPLDVPSQVAGELLQVIGSLMREMVSGVMEILRARAEIKSEFRMQLTTIRPVENNPLKFSVNVEDAINRLLVSSNDAYLPPLESVHQAIEDIEAHQMAVMAGMQAALSSMLQRFEPAALEEYFARKGGRSLLESKKAWYWEQYADKHKEILMEAEDNFQDLFGEEFAQAYEYQIKKLAEARKKGSE